MSGIAYGIARALCLAIGWALFRFRASGREHVPKTGGVLVAANHASYLDIPAVGCALPRRAFYLGRYDLFRLPLVGRMLRWLGWIPMRHDRLDRQGMGHAIQLVREGKLVVLYPEGTRSRDGRLGPGKPGIGVLVAETKCPVIPVYVEGTHRVLPVGASWPRLHPIRVLIGAPVDFSDDCSRLSGKELFYHVSRTVMEHIAKLGQVPHPTAPSDRSAGATTPGSQPAARP